MYNNSRGLAPNKPGVYLKSKRSALDREWVLRRYILQYVLLGWPSFVSFKHSAYLTFQVTQVYFTASRDVIYRILIKCTRGRILITTVGITYALLLSLLVLSPQEEYEMHILYVTSNFLNFCKIFIVLAAPTL